MIIISLHGFSARLWTASRLSYPSTSTYTSHNDPCSYYNNDKMGYLLYSLGFFFFAILTVLFFTRQHWIPMLPTAEHLPFPFNVRYSPLGGSFEDDAEAGLSSADFDLAGNIEGGDSRAGLDDRAKAVIQRIMKRHNLGFDEARRKFMQERFKKNNVRVSSAAVVQERSSNVHSRSVRMADHATPSLSPSAEASSTKVTPTFPSYLKAQAFLHDLHQHCHQFLSCCNGFFENPMGISVCMTFRPCHKALSLPSMC